MADKLMPCPFCGAMPTFSFPPDGYPEILCDNCFQAGTTLGNDTREEAIAAWNTRAERTCYADELTHQRCRYSVNRGWRERTCHWELEHSGTLYDKYRCSKCGYLHVESRTDGGATDLDPSYCPNCGARVVTE